ncbi:aromatic-ring-hydroxylating dioxygenase subunit beta [Streptomyces sp. NPDC052042]|uniref:aromatic-ring-hydroxylating dioxygenase subunit beta n=1 Tax=Streptomyces sp. NPDC052042 TaxID=3365683 RepID=UPI0037D16334
MFTETGTGTGTVERLPLTDPAALAAVELIYEEARLLDDKRYRDWEALWDEGETRYVLPMSREATDFDAVLNYVNDDAVMRHRRVERMAGGYAGAVESVGRTVRTVSRFTADRTGDDEVRVTSTEIVAAYQRGEHQLWAAEMVHHIVGRECGPRIRTKIVHLIDAEHTLRTCGFLL